MIVDGCGNMGHLVEVTLCSKGGSHALSVHPISPSVRPDERLESRVRAIDEEIESRLGVRLTTLPQDRICTRRRTGELVAKAFREHYGTDIALVQSGGIRADLRSGDITLRDVYSILPYENRVIPVRLPGHSIRRLLEKAIIDGDDAALSGVEIDRSDQDPIIRVDGAPLEEDKEYTIALSEYVLSGGGGFDKIADSSYLLPPDRADTDSDILIRYLSSHSAE